MRPIDPERLRALREGIPERRLRMLEARLLSAEARADYHQADARWWQSEYERERARRRALEEFIRRRQGWRGWLRRLTACASC